MRHACFPLVLAAATVWAGGASGQVAPYNPYADAHEAVPPVAADGTIHWGTFYKSAQVQQAYERLWNLGACRGSNRAITVPVAENKLVIDRLPEAEFKGLVQATAGQAAGGMIAFAEQADSASGTEPLVAQLHPAGVTRFSVVGRAPASLLAVGMVVRMRAEVDERGRGTEPVAAFEIVTPPADFRPDAVRPNHMDTVVGTVVSLRKSVLGLRVDAGTLRRLTLQLAPDAVATIDAARLDLVSPGDSIAAKGRLWTGDGSMAAGTVFVSDVIVSKRPLDGPVASVPEPRMVGSR